MQGDVDGSLGCCIVRSDVIDIGEDVVQLERIGELGEVHPFEEFDHRGLRFAQVGRRYGLAVAHHSVVFYLYLHQFGKSPGRTRYGKLVEKFGFVGFECEFHLFAAAFLDRRGFRAAHHRSQYGIGCSGQYSGAGYYCCFFEKIASIFVHLFSFFLLFVKNSLLLCKIRIVFIRSDAQSLVLVANDARGMYQDVHIGLGILGMFGVETVHVYVARLMDKASIAHVDTHVPYPLGRPGRHCGCRRTPDRPAGACHSPGKYRRSAR